MNEIQVVLDKAARDITARFKRRHGLLPEMETEVLRSSLQIAENAYTTALKMRKDMPKEPEAMKLPKVPDGLDADTRAELERLGQRLLEEDRQRSLRRHADTMKMTRDLVTVLFKTVGIGEETAEELTGLVFPD